MRWLKAVALAVAFAVGFAAVGLIFPMCQGSRLGARIRGAIQVGWFRMLGQILGLAVERFGARPEAGLWVANHISWLDVVVLGAHGPVTFIAKDDLTTWPVIGALARKGGVLFVERGRNALGRATVQAVRDRLAHGENVLLFPEGTTTRGTGVARFHSGLFQAAIEEQVALVPVALTYGGACADKVPFIGEDEFLPHLWRLLDLDDLRVRLDVLPAVPAASMNRDALAREAREAILERVEDELYGRMVVEFAPYAQIQQVCA